MGLGIGFTYVGNEYKIKVGNHYNYIDFLLFNYEYNCFVVIELKALKAYLQKGFSDERIISRIYKLKMIDNS